MPLPLMGPPLPSELFQARLPSYSEQEDVRAGTEEKEEGWV